MKFWDNGFYLTQNSENARAEIEDEYYNYLLSEQAKGKVIYSDNGYPKLKEYEPSQQDLDDAKIAEDKARLSELTKDLAQVQAGLIVPDIEDKKQEFQTLLNEVRTLQGKQPRETE